MSIVALGMMGIEPFASMFGFEPNDGGDDDDIWILALAILLIFIVGGLLLVFL